MSRLQFVIDNKTKWPKYDAAYGGRTNCSKCVNRKKGGGCKINWSHTEDGMNCRNCKLGTKKRRITKDEPDKLCIKE